MFLFVVLQILPNEMMWYIETDKMHVHGQEDEASRLQTVWGCQKDGGRRKRETRMKRDCKATLLKEAHLALQLHGQLKTIQYADRFQAHQHVEWSRWLRSRRNWIQRACIQEESHCHTAPPKNIQTPSTYKVHQGTSYSYTAPFHHLSYDPRVLRVFLRVFDCLGIFVRPCSPRPLQTSTTGRSPCKNSLSRWRLVHARHPNTSRRLGEFFLETVFSCRFLKRREELYEQKPSQGLWCQGGDIGHQALHDGLYRDQTYPNLVKAVKRPMLKWHAGWLWQEAQRCYWWENSTRKSCLRTAGRCPELNPHYHTHLYVQSIHLSLVYVNIV